MHEGSVHESVLVHELLASLVGVESRINRRYASFIYISLVKVRLLEIESPIEHVLSCFASSRDHISKILAYVDV